MKTLVVFYSLEGNTKFVAENIASEIGADVLELKPKKELNPKSGMRFFWGGMQVTMKRKPELLPLGKNPQDYDVLFIGTPVWAWNCSPPVSSFLSGAVGKKVALFCIRSGNKGKVFETMRSALEGNEILGEMDFLEPLKSKEESAAKAKKWAREIVGKL